MPAPAETGGQPVSSAQVRKTVKQDKAAPTVVGSTQKKTMPLKDKEALTYISELQENDILLGRGAPSVRHAGNRNFRKLIQERLDDYMSTSRHHLKDQIARQVVETVHQRGGRFLRKLDSPSEATKYKVPAGQHAWLQATDEAMVLEKVKQAFRDNGNESHKANKRKMNNKSTTSASAAAAASGAGGQAGGQPSLAMQQQYQQQHQQHLQQQYPHLAMGGGLHNGMGMGGMPTSHGNGGMNNNFGGGAGAMEYYNNLQRQQQMSSMGMMPGAPPMGGNNNFQNPYMAGPPGVSPQPPGSAGGAGADMNFQRELTMLRFQQQLQQEAAARAQMHWAAQMHAMQQQQQQSAMTNAAAGTAATAKAATAIASNTAGVLSNQNSSPTEAQLLGEIPGAYHRMIPLLRQSAIADASAFVSGTNANSNNNATNSSNSTATTLTKNDVTVLLQAQETCERRSHLVGLTQIRDVLEAILAHPERHVGLDPESDLPRLREALQRAQRATERIVSSSKAASTTTATASASADKTGGDSNGSTTMKKDKEASEKDPTSKDSESQGQDKCSSSDTSDKARVDEEAEKKKMQSQQVKRSVEEGNESMTAQDEKPDLAETRDKESNTTTQEEQPKKQKIS